MADANMLQQAISYAANGTGLSVGLHLSRESGIVAARVDMDQSQELEDVNPPGSTPGIYRSEEHTSELQSLMRISYAVFCLKKKQTYISVQQLSTYDT